MAPLEDPQKTSRVILETNIEQTSNRMRHCCLWGLDGQDLQVLGDLRLVQAGGLFVLTASEVIKTDHFRVDLHVF